MATIVLFFYFFPLSVLNTVVVGGIGVVIRLVVIGLLGGRKFFVIDCLGVVVALTIAVVIDGFGLRILSACRSEHTLAPPPEHGEEHQNQD